MTCAAGDGTIVGPSNDDFFISAVVLLKTAATTALLPIEDSHAVIVHEELFQLDKDMEEKGFHVCGWQRRHRGKKQ